MADVAADPSLLPLFASVQSSFGWTRGALATHGWLDWLATLPLETRIELDDGTRLLGVHASPGRDDGAGVTPHRPEAELQAETVAAAADIVVTGHTHQPTDRTVDGTRFLNGGSVSNPITDDSRAGYVIIHSDPDHHLVEHRRVAYDVDRFLAVVEQSGHPERDYIASFQRGEQFRYPAHRPGAPVVDD
jgi:diadenosine tetraphosphatase ApaH/serine/threonine PP2A family protein phosphatase